MTELNTDGQILLYQAADGQFKVDVRLQGDTVWLTQKQMVELFQTTKQNISLHINNIFTDGELAQNSTVKEFLTVQNEGNRQVQRNVTYYNLDVIIAVGYRVNAKRGTQFRMWATRTLKGHLLNGYTINQKRLIETGLTALENALQFIKNTSSKKELTNQEAQGLLDVIANYAKSWLLLKRYDENCLIPPKGTPPTFILSYEIALNAIANLKIDLIAKNQASEIFGIEREEGLRAILGNLEQTFGGEKLYPSFETRAAHLLYFIIKDHPLLDGNKRVASLLFIYYLNINGRLRKTNGEMLINDNALVALALLIAESEPKNKDLMIQLVENLLAEF